MKFCNKRVIRCFRIEFRYFIFFLFFKYANSTGSTRFLQLRKNDLIHMIRTFHFCCSYYKGTKNWSISRFTRPSRIAWLKFNRQIANRKFHCPNREKDEKKQTIGYSVGIRSGSDVAGLPGARVDSRVEADFARRCTSDVTIKRTTSDERIRAAHEERGGELWLDFKASN